MISRNNIPSPVTPKQSVHPWDLLRALATQFQCKRYDLRPASFLLGIAIVQFDLDFAVLGCSLDGESERVFVASYVECTSGVVLWELLDGAVTLSFYHIPRRERVAVMNAFNGCGAYVGCVCPYRFGQGGTG